MLQDIQEYPNLCHKIIDKSSDLEIVTLFSCEDYEFTLF